MNRGSSILGTPAGKSWIIAGSVLIIAVVTVLIAVSGTGFNWLWLIPPALVLFLAAILSIDKFLLFTVFLVPLSIQLRFIFPDVTADLFLPTEPMLALIMVIIIFKAFATGEIDKRILCHPVTGVTGILLVWLFITSLTGTMPLVSFKYMITRIWFITGFYLLASQLFKKERMIRNYFLAYLLGMTPVAIYYLIRLSQSGVLNQVTAYSAIRPFFNDHTVLGASLAFCIPVTVYLLSVRGDGFLRKLLLFIQLVIFSTAFIFSYSRAAWISLTIAVFVTIILLLRISWKVIVPVLTITIILLITSWTALMIRLNENRQGSSLEISKQLQSIANIRTDVSNLERINRWRAALRMSSERPLFGWGPGSYQFNYAPFQMSDEKTVISTNWGERGNAHSEYLGLLAESGIPGMAIYLVLIFVIIRKGILLFKKAAGKRGERIMLLCMVAGLITYVTHGVLNNFLDTDKISALFWGMTAVIVTADLRVQDENEKTAQ
jgi:putative inorganic carbon (hco3(-)) transporter